MRILNYFINRAGRGLSATRRRTGKSQETPLPAHQAEKGSRQSSLIRHSAKALSLEQCGAAGNAQKALLCSPSRQGRFRWNNSRPATSFALLELTFHSLDEHSQLLGLMIPLRLFTHFVEVLRLLLFSKGHGERRFLCLFESLAYSPGGRLPTPLEPDVPSGIPCMTFAASSAQAVASHPSR